MKIFYVTIALYALSLFALAAHAQEGQIELLCAPAPPMMSRIKNEYKEKLVATATINNQALAVFAAKDGSFTLLLIQPEGLACVLGSGQDWQYFLSAESL